MFDYLKTEISGHLGVLGFGGGVGGGIASFASGFNLGMFTSVIVMIGSAWNIYNNIRKAKREEKQDSEIHRLELEKKKTEIKLNQAQLNEFEKNNLKK